MQILTIEDERQYGLERGAFSFMTKTVTTDNLEVAFDRLKSFTNARLRQLLVVEDDPAEQLSVSELLGHERCGDHDRRDGRRGAGEDAGGHASIVWCWT